jgi:glycosyltransferase involved in cell wall biosynthesis
MNKQLQGSKHILIIVENLPVPFDRRVWQEAKTLDQAGYQVSVICPKFKGYSKSREIIEGIHVYRHTVPLEGNGVLSYFTEYLIALLFQFFIALRIYISKGFDVIHACNPPDNIFLIGTFFKLFGKKFVFDHHDINPELYEAKFGRRDFFYKVMLLSERLTFKLADISIATNESYKKIAIERGGMDPDKVFIVRSGPKIEQFKILPPTPTYKNGKNFLVGYIGVIGKQEGISYLLESIHHIVFVENRHDVYFQVIGGGPELEKVMTLTQELNVSDYVTFTGRISDEQVLAILNTADICVNPDEANEMNDKSTMNKVMEYMALGKPIVQFDLKEGRFSAAKSSLYAEKNNSKDFALKILALLDNPELREEMGKIGNKRVREKLAWEHQAPELIKAYEKLFHQNL